MLVNYNGGNVHTLRGTKGVEFRFLPGTNEVPDDVWEDLKGQSDSCANMLDVGTLKELRLPKAKPADAKPGKLARVGEEAPADTLADVDISRVATPDALELISGIVDEAHIVRFIEQESKRKAGNRKVVMAKLEEQLKIAKTPLDADPNVPGADPTKASQSKPRARKLLGLG